MLASNKPSMPIFLISALIALLPIISAQNQEATDDFFYSEKEVKIGSLKVLPNENTNYFQ